jgi:hypothetical protein
MRSVDFIPTFTNKIAVILTGYQPAAAQTNTRASVRPQSADSWTVQGSRTNIESKANRRKNLSPRTAGKVTAAQTAVTRKPKVRNYNLKDDLASST